MRTMAAALPGSSPPDRLCLCRRLCLILCFNDRKGTRAQKKSGPVAYLATKDALHVPLLFQTALAARLCAFPTPTPSALPRSGAVNGAEKTKIWFSGSDLDFLQTGWRTGGAFIRRACKVANVWLLQETGVS